MKLNAHESFEKLAKIVDDISACDLILTDRAECDMWDLCHMYASQIDVVEARFLYLLIQVEKHRKRN